MLGWREVFNGLLWLSPIEKVTFHHGLEVVEGGDEQGELLRKSSHRQQEWPVRGCWGGGRTSEEPSVLWREDQGRNIRPCDSPLATVTDPTVTSRPTVFKPVLQPYLPFNRWRHRVVEIKRLAPGHRDGTFVGIFSLYGTALLFESLRKCQRVEAALSWWHN